ncbi:MAG TPA: DUF58 domain-containing protein, partial [Leptospiraceae bacterium]|nr:DUF58 domain-containing protein [Leptospiraceae bacterium]
MISEKDLLQRVRNLELVGRKNAHSLLNGEYSTKIPGNGLQFHEARKYVSGESIRLIDWNITARQGEPYVKVLLEEREREIVIALDLSQSMHSGFQDRTKLEYAVELAASVAVSAADSRDRVGCILFTDRTELFLRPRRGRIQLFKCLKAFLEYSEKSFPERNTDAGSALMEVFRQKSKRQIVFLISDFTEKEILSDMKYTTKRTDLNFFHIYDPVEYSGFPSLLFQAEFPETGGSVFSRGT